MGRVGTVWKRLEEFGTSVRQHGTWHRFADFACWGGKANRQDAKATGRGGFVLQFSPAGDAVGSFCRNRGAGGATETRRHGGEEKFELSLTPAFLRVFVSPWRIGFPRKTGGVMRAVDHGGAADFCKQGNSRRICVKIVLDFWFGAVGFLINGAQRAGVQGSGRLEWCGGWQRESVANGCRGGGGGCGLLSGVRV